MKSTTQNEKVNTNLVIKENLGNVNQVFILQCITSGVITKVEARRLLFTEVVV